ncbi:MAG: hypothetical protein WC975_01700 [Phycisphaerae bacterium]
MNISNISTSPMHTTPAKPEKTKVPTVNTTTDNEISAQVPAGEETSEQGTESKGVLRLLAEGHFKPVADVRLRINFYEELAQQSNANTSEQVTALNTKIMNDISGLMASVPGSDSQQFTDAKNTLEQALSSQQSISPDAQTQTKKALDEFLAAVKEIFTPAPIPPAEETEPSQDTSLLSDVPLTTEAASDTGENLWLSSLQQIMDTYFQNLSKISSDSQDSMEIQPAENVSGKAYAKFLGIYNSLIDTSA